MQTIVIDIAARYKDETSRGINNSSKNLDKLNRSLEKTKKQTDQAKTSFDRLMATVKSAAYRTISIPVKIIDNATRPLRSILNYATSLKGILSGIAVGVGVNKLIRSPLGLADQIESAQIFFENKLGSAANAQKFLQDIYAFDKKSPFDTMQIIETVKSMMGVGWTEKDVLKDIGIIGDAAASLGQGTQGVSGISRQLGQMRMKSRLSQEEVSVLNEYGINAWKYIAEGLGLGSSEEAMMKAREMNEKGNGINGAMAVQYILAGMERDFGGSSQQMADRTVSGIFDQVKSQIQNQIFLKWGQGLAVGTKKGLGILQDLLNKNEDKIVAFGDKLQDLGEDISVGIVDKLQGAYDKLNTIMDSDVFKNADAFGKMGIIWDEMIVQPLSEWWDGSGRKSVTDKASQIGEVIGTGIVNGAKASMSRLLPAMVSDVGTLVPGGEKASSTSLLSLLALAWGGNKLFKLGKGALAGAGGLLTKVGLGGTAGGSLLAKAGLLGTKLGAVGGVTATALGAGSALGGVAGGLGVISGVNDLTNGEKAKGLTKLGMVGAGAGTGAAIGSFLLPGLGTLGGALIGAGFGGIGALTKGGAIGEWIGEKFSSPKTIQKNPRYPYATEDSNAAGIVEKTNNVNCNVTINLEGYGDADTVILNSLTSNMPILVNQISSEISKGINQIASNMPLAALK